MPVLMDVVVQDPNFHLIIRLTWGRHMKNLKTYAIVAIGVIAIGASALVYRHMHDPNRVYTDEENASVIQEFAANNYIINKELRNILIEAGDIVKNDPTFNTFGYTSLLASSIRDGDWKEKDIDFLANRLVINYKEKMQKDKNMVEVDKLNKRLQDLEKSAEEAGFIKNIKNVIPKVGSSCPSGYDVAGDYCQQR